MLIFNCTVDWCEHTKYNLGEKLSETGYDDFKTTQNACIATADKGMMGESPDYIFV